MGIVSVNLSLSSLCNGDCIFCPTNRGKRIKQKIMPFTLAKRIIDEVSSPEFSKEHSVKKFEVGENGEAFLNPEIINILRYIKLKSPEVCTRVFTNFQKFTKEKSEIILREGLLDVIFLDIDGHDNHSYYQVKRLSLDVLRRNLHDFLTLRREFDAKIRLNLRSITLAEYISKIKDNLGFSPSRLEDISLDKIIDDHNMIVDEWSKLLDPKTDTIRRTPIFGWAERHKIDTRKIDHKSYSCPNLKRVKEECFIASDGTWYACCYDSNNELVIGNVEETPIAQLYHSEKRLRLIQLLEEREFNRIDGPCKTVNCCQSL